MMALRQGFMFLGSQQNFSTLRQEGIGNCQVVRLRWAHLASAVFLAISRRRSAVNFRLRALPPDCRKRT